MASTLRGKCIWALATLGYTPSHAWLSQLADSAFLPNDVDKLTPGDFTDGLWGIFTLQCHQQQQLPSAARDVAPSISGGSSGSDDGSSGSDGGFLSVQLMQALERKLYKRVHELQPPQVLRLLELAEGATEYIPGYKLPSGIGEQMSATLSARATAISDTAGVLSLAWAAANLELPLHGSAKDHICRKLYGQLGVLSASDMARGFWSSAKLRYG
jgi:hypothetical protein